jgi:hypothetical protein
MEAGRRQNETGEQGMMTTNRRYDTTAYDDAPEGAVPAVVRILHALWIALVLVVGLLTLIAVLAKRPATGALYRRPSVAAAPHVAPVVDPRSVG